MLETANGVVNGDWTKVFRDKGAAKNMVGKSFVAPGSEAGPSIRVRFPDWYSKDIVEVFLLVH